jgi:hypothetical protein
LRTSGGARANGSRGEAGGEVPEHGDELARPVVSYLVFRGALHAPVTFCCWLLCIILFSGFQERGWSICGLAGTNREAEEGRSQEPRDNVLDWGGRLEFCRATAAESSGDLRDYGNLVLREVLR